MSRTYPGIALTSSTDDKVISIPLSFQTKSLKIHIAVDCRHIILHNMNKVRGGVDILCNISVILVIYKYDSETLL